MTNCIADQSKAAANANRFGILALTWTVVAFVSLLSYGILLWTDTQTSLVGRNTLFAIGVTTTLTASIFGGVALYYQHRSRANCFETCSQKDTNN